VVASRTSTPFGVPEHSAAYAREWRRCIVAAEAFADTSPDRVIVVRYEDVVLDPTAFVARVCSFLGLSAHPSMLSEFAAEMRRNSVPSEVWKGRVELGTIEDRRGSWRETLSAGDAWLVETLTARERSRLGYPSESNATAGEKVAAVRAAGLRKWRALRRRPDLRS
jgi:hypothetical protein